MSHPMVNELIARIYDTVLVPEHWPTVLMDIAGSIGGTGVIIFERSSGGGDRDVDASHLSANYDPAILHAYLSRFTDHELDDQSLFEQTSMVSDSVELISAEAISRAGRPLSQQPNVRFLRFLGLQHRAAALLNKDEPWRDRFSVQFSAGRGPITPAEAATANLLLPHVAKALAMSRHFRQLQESRAIALSSLDRLRLGVAITDSTGRPLFENREFKRMTDSRGLIGRDRAGRLTTRKPGPQAELARLFADVGGHGRYGARPRKEAVIVDRDDAVSGLCLEVCPVHRLEDASSAPLDGYLITCLDTDTVLDLDLAAMSRAFGLTGAEERVLGYVTAGRSNSEIAEAACRSVETVNSQVKALLAKTGCGSRTQLVRLAVGLGQRVTEVIRGMAAFLVASHHSW